MPVVIGRVVRFATSARRTVQRADTAHAGLSRAQGAGRTRRCLERPVTVRTFQIDEDLFAGGGQSERVATDLVQVIDDFLYVSQLRQHGHLFALRRSRINRGLLVRPY